MPHLDLSDVQSRDPDNYAKVGLSRALAAFAVANVSDMSPDHACHFVIDGYDDNGIDALYFNMDERSLVICQSKWSEKTGSAPDTGDCEKFARGVRDLLAMRFDRFNDRLKEKYPNISTLINSVVQVHIIIAYSGSSALSKHQKRVFEDLLDELNDTGDVATFEVQSQQALYSVVARGGQGTPVNLIVQLFDWGQTKDPFQAFYGQVAGSDIAQWGAEWRTRLFSKNIRSFLGGSTAVNEGIAESIRTSPKQFWYLNNGITAICESIRKLPVGGNSRDSGTFECKGVAIVNGAQTVGTISELGAGYGDQLEHARVPIRFISLEGCPPEFANDVTRATNTQNRIDARNFVALDPEQERLRSELAVDGVNYEYRQGEGEPDGTDQFGLVDATVALACSQKGPDLAVQAKREISKLWEDLARPPYKLLFNSSLSGMHLWHMVEILRLINYFIEEEKYSFGDENPRDLAVLVNGNRLIAHIVFNSIDLSMVGSEKFEINELEDIISHAVEVACRKLTEAVNQEYPDSYLAVLFKNATKCKELVVRISPVRIDYQEIERRRAAEDALLSELNIELPF
jgi:hypothetical protein